MELGPNGGLLYSRRRAGVRKGAGAAVGGVSLPPMEVKSRRKKHNPGDKQWYYSKVLCSKNRNASPRIPTLRE